MFKPDEPTVYIPTRGRLKNVTKLLDLWDQESFFVVLVVEEHEAEDHRKLVHEMKMDPYAAVIVPPYGVEGIGPIRKWIVEHAASCGLKSIILSDDDIKPGKDSNMKELWEQAQHYKVLGITARYSYHDFSLGPEIKYRDDLILMPNGTFRIIGLNIMNALAIGNYDPHLICVQEDGELMMRGVQNGFPWLIHLGTKTGSIHGRYQPGGIADFMGSMTERFRIQRQCHIYLNEKHPDYVNKPKPDDDLSQKNGVRISWRKLYNDWLPEWKTWSALHGGDIEEYLES